MINEGPAGAVEDRPIGYWLRRLDQLIDAAFQAALAEHGLTRGHWQLLNLLAGRARADAEVAAVLGPLLPAGQDGVGAVIAELAGRGWISRDPAGQWQLTLSGRAGHTELAADVDAVRRRSAAGLRPEEYVGAVRVLARMAANLEA